MANVNISNITVPRTARNKRVYATSGGTVLSGGSVPVSLDWVTVEALKVTLDRDLAIDTLTASQIVETDADKKLVSVAKGTAYNKNFGTTGGTVSEGHLHPYLFDTDVRIDNWNEAYNNIVHNHDTLYKPLTYFPTWGEITGIPTEFTPSVHSHAAEAWFTGALAAKMDVHTHPYLSDSDVRIADWNAAYNWGDHTQLYKPLTWFPSWAEISNIPTSFTPSAHNHSAEGWFTTALAGKLDSADGRIANWDTAYGWGDHSNLYAASDHMHEGVYALSDHNHTGVYLSEITKQMVEAVLTGTISSHTHAGGSYLGTTGQQTLTGTLIVTDEIAVNNKGNASMWYEAYGWGNHASMNYLTSESDPVFTSHAAYGITGTNISNWNTAYGWGNHTLLYLPFTGGHVTGNLRIGSVSNNRTLFYTDYEGGNAGMDIGNPTLGITFSHNSNNGDTYSKQFKTTRYYISPNGANMVYNIVDASDTYTGMYGFQAGAGSSGYGGSLVLYGHSHALFPGWIKAGISASSGGKFSVNNLGLGQGTDVFTVDASGEVNCASITTTGNVNVGQTLYINTQLAIHAGNIGTQSVNYATSSNYAATAGNADTLDNYHATAFLILNGGNQTMTGSLTAYDFILSSDARLKRNITDYTPVRLNTNYKSFSMWYAPNKQRFGVIAQELMGVAPEHVHRGLNGFLEVSYIDLFAREISYLKFMDSKNEMRFLTNESKIQQLQSQIENLQSQINQLRQAS